VCVYAQLIYGGVTQPDGSQFVTGIHMKRPSIVSKET